MLKEKKRERVAFVAMNPPNRYSGGRLYTMWLAYGFAANGFEVDFYTNCVPKFMESFPDDESTGRIQFHINKNYLWKAENHQYKAVVMAPHLASRKSPVFDRFLFYPFARRLKRKNDCELWYIDFESPAWIEAIDKELRPFSAYKYSNKVLPNCDRIISISNTGLKYAKLYYSRYNPNLAYNMIYPIVNMFAVGNTIIDNKENSAVFIARFGQKHKNNESVFNMIKCLPEGFEFDIVGNKDAADPSFISELMKKAQEKKINLKFFKNITDEEKFNLFGKAKLMFFPSKFEGFGIPPLEAQYMGTSVICSDLEVLREVNKRAQFVDFSDLQQLETAVNNILTNPPTPGELRKYVEEIASPKALVKNVEMIIK